MYVVIKTIISFIKNQCTFNIKVIRKRDPNILMVQMFNTQSVQIGNEINLQLIQAHKK